ncbi:unnamed protein product [Lactuca saligna]|uniref:Uncharacterized protein n=1 Tax=Lactuca saligna TaxID=75948 RepID=A0AA35ZMF4_LACSI|nr:unnamed protein product [Lactuca saligna]
MKENPKKKIVEPTNETEQKPNTKDQKDNEASALKGKEKVVDDEEEVEVLSEGEKLIRKKQGVELDNLLRVCQVLEAKNTEADIAKKYKPIIAHLKRMLICYIQEFAKMDVEITAMLKKKLFMQPKEESKDLNKMKLG